MSYEGIVILNYELGEKLGEGGFGAVYLAEHRELGRKAACKILHPQFSRHPEVVDRFFREARAVCAIGHRAIIDIENFGTLDSGESFYLMEFFPGASLAERIIERPLRLDELHAVFDPVACALLAAHDKHIVHRDLKPDNIMLLEDGGVISDVKLLDFGIAKLVDATDMVASQTGNVLGTPTFMAPEQARDAKNVDVRADVYGFAATVFAGLAGRPPFTAISVTEVIVQVQTVPAPPLRSFAPHAPAELEAVLARCLEKDPAKRPESLRDAWQQMCDCVGATPFTSSAAPGASASRSGRSKPITTLSAASGSLEVAKTVAADTDRRWSRWLWVAAAVVVLGSVAATVLALRGGSDRPGAGPTPVIDAADAADAAAAATSPPVAAPPDAAPPPPPDPIDAAPPDAAPRPASRRPPRRSGPRRPPPLRTDCSKTSFERVYSQAEPTEASVRAALARLRECKAELGSSYPRIQARLIQKL